MTHAALILSLLFLILTKVADVVTTARGIRRSGSVSWEQNPLARWAMLRFGAAGGMVFVMVLWSLLTAVCYVAAWFASAWFQWTTTVGGVLIAWAQLEVARFNANGTHS